MELNKYISEITILKQNWIFSITTFSIKLQIQPEK